MIGVSFLVRGRETVSKIVRNTIAIRVGDRVLNLLLCQSLDYVIFSFEINNMSSN